MAQLTTTVPADGHREELTARLPSADLQLAAHSEAEAIEIASEQFQLEIELHGDPDLDGWIAQPAALSAYEIVSQEDPHRVIGWQIDTV